MVTLEEYTRHIDWSLTVGRRRTRQTARQAASTMRELEGAQALLEAEEAVDDQLRMARCLLAGKAVAGIVTAVDREHREVVTTNRAPRRAAGHSALILERRRPARRRSTPDTLRARQSALADLAFCIVSE